MFLPSLINSLRFGQQKGRDWDWYINTWKKTEFIEDPFKFKVSSLNNLQTENIIFKISIPN